MSLVEKQFEFALHVSSLINKAEQLGFMCSLGEAYRPPEMAKIYASTGKGILNSQHCKRLAIDLQLFDIHGNYLDEPQHYDMLGAYWKSLTPLNRYGGDFPRRDANHFEMQEK
jgi:hypothetical protein